MKRLTSAAIFFAGAIVASQSAFGQFTPNNLYMGFQNGGVGTSNADYIINLGSASSIVGGSSVVDLSSDFSLSDYDLVLGISSSLWAGVVGGSSASSPTSDLYLTELRVGGAGNPATPGSSLSSIFSRADDNGAAAQLGPLNVSATPGGMLDPTKTWESQVEPTFTTGSYYGETGINPDSQVGANSVLYEDLWYNSNSSISGASGFSYLGYFTLDTGSSPSLTFTPEEAPEPSVTFFTGAGLLVLLLRKRYAGIKSLF